MTLALPARQVAYFVQNVRAAAVRHRTAFGSGPYLVAEHIPLSVSRHRGVSRPLDHTSAYGQWGPVMVEFVQQNNPGPSCFHDVYPEGSGREGLHHMAVFVDDIEVAIAGHAREGRETALYAELGNGFAFAMIDAVATLGHMIELYQPVPSLLAHYDRVAALASAADDVAPFVEINFG